MLLLFGRNNDTTLPPLPPTHTHLPAPTVFPYTVLISIGRKGGLLVTKFLYPFFQGGVTPIDSIVTAATALSQRSTVKPPK